MEISLNAALRTADVRTVLAAIDAAVHKSANLLRLAESAGLDRSTLYRAFRSEKIGPNLDVAIKILSALGFQLVVEFMRQPKSRTNRFARSRNPDVRVELRSNSKLASEYLTRAFETSEIAAIVAAFSDVLRAQENVMEFAEITTRTRSGLYRAFREPRIPKLNTIIRFLDALGLRLAVKPLPDSQRSPLYSRK